MEHIVDYLNIYNRVVYDKLQNLASQKTVISMGEVLELLEESGALDFKPVTQRAVQFLHDVGQVRFFTFLYLTYGWFCNKYKISESIYLMLLYVVFFYL